VCNWSDLGKETRRLGFGVGCRVRLIYDLDRFQNLRSERDRVKRGVLVSEQAKNRVDSTPQAKGSVLLAAHAEDNPVLSAEHLSVQSRALSHTTSCSSDCSMNSSQRSEIIHSADLPHRSEVCIQL
jgi:hypothetical protein